MNYKNILSKTSENTALAIICFSIVLLHISTYSQKKINLSDQPLKIHVFGESHSWFSFTNGASGLTPESSFSYTYNKKTLFNAKFYIHWLGPITMHRIGRDGFSSSNVTENDIVIFVFGETDVRCHIGKQRDEYKRSLDEVIMTLSTNYINAIKGYKNSYKNITCCICQVIPPTNACYNPQFPFYGSLEDRAFITQQLNKSLEKMCLSNDLLFLDCYGPFTSKEGTLIYELSDGCVHLKTSTNSPVKEKVLDIIIESAINKTILQCEPDFRLTSDNGPAS